MQDSPLSLFDVPLFQGLAEQELADIEARAHLRTFQQGEELVHSGEEAPGLFVIKSGAVSAVVTADGALEREVATLGKGECVGEMALLTGEPPSATVRAMTRTEAWLLESEACLELLESYPSLWRNFGHILSMRLARTSRHLLARTQSTLVPLLTDCEDDQAAALAMAWMAPASPGLAPRAG